MGTRAAACLGAPARAKDAGRSARSAGRGAPCRGASLARCLGAPLARHCSRTPVVPPRGRRSRRRDHPQLPRGIVRERFPEVVGQPSDAILGRDDIPWKRSGHTGECGGRRCGSLLPMPKLAMCIAEPRFQLRCATRQLLGTRDERATPPFDTPRNRQRERRRHQRQNREPTRRIDGSLRGSRTRGPCIRPRIQETPPRSRVDIGPV